jgi:hypothetical protein|tara:strand:- start:161 stop:517 length:357 start_codon:yes stop_codon:yes gene_type:complete
LCVGTHPAFDEVSVKHRQQQRVAKHGTTQHKTCAFTNHEAVVKQQHCAGAKMASSEFVRLFKETPGAMLGGERGRGPACKESTKTLKANDYELIFAKQKNHGEKTIAFETFLAPNSVP